MGEIRRTPRSRVFNGSGFNCGDTTNTGPYVNADHVGVFLSRLQVSVFDGFITRDHAELNESVHVSRVFFRHVVRRNECVYLAGYRDRIVVCVK